MYYKEKQERKAHSGRNNDGYDDENYDLILQENETINGRYVIGKRLGKGSFGQVVCCYDRERNNRVAVKIIKSKRPFFQQAQTEIELLRHLNGMDADDKWYIGKICDANLMFNGFCYDWTL